MFSFRRTPRNLLVTALLAATVVGFAACRKPGTTLGIQTRILLPAGSQLPAGATTVQVLVKQYPSATAQSALTVGLATFQPSAAWTIPDTGADPSHPLYVEVQAQDAAGNVLSIGRTRTIDPRFAAKQVYGIFLAPPGQYSPPPTQPNAPRSHGGVAVMDDGRVVLAGGLSATSSGLSSVELYDPDGGTWTTIGQMSVPRLDPGIAALPDGRVLVAGGVDPATGDALQTAEYVLPAIEPGESPLPTGIPAPLPKAWSAMHSARLPSGKVLFAGGFATTTSNLPVAAVFNPADGSWLELGGASYAGGAGIAAMGGTVAIVGGTSNGATLSTVQVLKEVAGVESVSSGKVLSVPRNGAAVAPVLIGNALHALVDGGAIPNGRTAAIELVDASGTLPTAAFAGERDLHHRSWRESALLADGRVLLAGGVNPGGTSDTVSEIWDPSTQQGEVTADLPTARQSHGNSVGSMADGNVLLAGADDATDVWIYTAPVIPLAPNNHVALTIGATLGTRVSGGVLDGAASLQVGIFDEYSQVDARSFPVSSSSLSWPSFLVTSDGLYVVVEGLSSTDGVLAWGATAYTLGPSAFNAGSFSILVGRAGEFVEAPTALPNPHGDGVSALLKDGTVAVVAGLGGPGDTDIFDPTDGSSSPLTSSVIPTQVTDPRATLRNGKLVVVGGLDPGTGDPVDASSVLDLGTQTWSAGATPQVALWEDALVTLPNGNLFCEGAESAAGVPLAASQLFNGTKWVSAGATTDARDEQQATLLSNGDVLITAGETSNGTITVANDALLYNPGARTYTPLAATLDTATRLHTAVAFGASQAIICGGRPTTTSTGVVSACEVFDGSNDSFTAVGTLADGGRDHISPAQTLDGKIFFVGGRIAGTARVPDVDIFDPVAQTMSAGASLVVPRSNTSVVTLADGRLVVTGGLETVPSGNPDVGLSSVEVYTPATWTNPYGY